jgi:hypothetical protein
MAISAAVNAIKPRKKLFTLTALDERPAFASTRYARRLVYIQLHTSMIVVVLQ